MSHCRQHFQRITAAEAAASASPQQGMAGANAYELQLAQLTQDRLRLKQIQSGEGKARLKQQLLPAYVPYVEGVLAAGRGAQDEVLTTVMVWRIDAGDYAGALDIAAYVLEHNLVMPDRFARTTGCLIAEEIAEAALKAQRAGELFDAQILARAGELTREQDMPDEARAKLSMAFGRAVLGKIDETTPDFALELQIGIHSLRRAIELHGSCGAKKDLERAERLLKKHAPTGAEPDPQGQDDAPAEG
jgi:hypothetical protein